VSKKVKERERKNQRKERKRAKTKKAKERASERVCFAQVSFTSYFYPMHFIVHNSIFNKLDDNID